MFGFRCLTLLIVTTCLFGSVGTLAIAQSGTRPTTPQQYVPANQGYPTSQGSGTHGSATQGSVTQNHSIQGSVTNTGSDLRNMAVAMAGFCPVCLVEMKEWVRGDSEFRASYDGKIYLFPEQKQLQMFQARPEKYAPVLGGDCVVEFANTGRRVAGELDFGVRHNGRVFFLGSEQNKEAFKAQPAKYESADLAAGGQCTVCRVEMNQLMPGRPEVTAVHHGMRYQFAGSKQRDMFLANPGKYESPAHVSEGSGTSQGSGTHQ